MALWPIEPEDRQELVKKMASGDTEAIEQARQMVKSCDGIDLTDIPLVLLDVSRTESAFDVIRDYLRKRAIRRKGHTAVDLERIRIMVNEEVLLGNLLYLSPDKSTIELAYEIEDRWSKSPAGSLILINLLIANPDDTRAQALARRWIEMALLKFKWVEIMTSAD